ncbi:MAG: ABC transporter ATP-binding protein, partial [Desulfuromonadales bacterium]|nr:ABC transporter ATP-binding protein [Desulfuromonadales bacterium]
ERELAELPPRIVALEEEEARLHATLADPELYRHGGPEVARLTARLPAIEQELATLYGRWEELEGIKSGEGE